MESREQTRGGRHTSRRRRVGRTGVGHAPPGTPRAGIVHNEPRAGIARDELRHEPAAQMPGDGGDVLHEWTRVTEYFGVDALQHVLAVGRGHEVRVVDEAGAERLDGFDRFDELQRRATSPLDHNSDRTAATSSR